MDKEYTSVLKWFWDWWNENKLVMTICALTICFVIIVGGMEYERSVNECKEECKMCLSSQYSSMTQLNRNNIFKVNLEDLEGDNDGKEK